ncbi:MAG: NAD(P)-dependent oxidoreductase [Gallionella sp.]
MKVLVTGASGFLGQHVLACLRKHGIDTVVSGRRLPEGIAVADFIEADLLAANDFAALVKVSGATHLLHLAWYAEHGKYWTSPLNLRWVEATVRLIEAFCEAGGQRVIVAGTCAEYDWSQGRCREDDTPLNPATLYGVAKDAAQRLVMAVCGQYQVSCAWGRLFLFYGRGEDNRRLVPSLIEVFRKKRQPFGVNAPARRDFLHASDVAEGFVTLLKSGESGAYNISSGEAVRLADMVRELAQLLDADPRAVLDLNGERPDEPLLLVGDNSKLKTLGWRPALSLVQGLELTVREALS